MVYYNVKYWKRFHMLHYSGLRTDKVRILSDGSNVELPYHSSGEKCLPAAQAGRKQERKVSYQTAAPVCIVK